MSKPTFTALCALVVLPSGAFADHSFAGADPALGQVLYGTHCASCHGAELEGQPDWRTPSPEGILPAPPHDVSGHTWHHDTQLLFDYTKFGGDAALAMRGIEGFTSGMPAFEPDLKDSQILDILAFIRTSWPTEAQEFQASQDHPAQ